MCDYSLQNVVSRPAVVGDKLVTKNFGTGTRGFTAVGAESLALAVCLLPGTEIAFDEPVEPFNHATAIFRQINKELPMTHHDAVEFPDGSSILLTLLGDNVRATVLQLPAAPKTEKEAEEQKRAEYVG